ncbi:hypothetical protein [Donghicola eburneus]|uniref:hypothetical protein n=1 Tax=Donghicola eburneus TaxID=393278 RepID=UPI0008E1682B|nr:hypothetical protein [Donghicola eburneus]SFQ52638.1 hypothetical protein SAMN05421764_105143 [Donghicola eburneus]
MGIILRKSTNHLPSDGHSVRLNTLEYFRTHKDPEIGDPQETKQEVRAVFQRYSVGSEFANTLVPGITGIDDFNALKRYGLTEQGSIQVEGASFMLDGAWRFHYTGSDAFVFCMSMLSEESAEIFGEYEGFWDIEATSADALAERILDFANSLLPSKKAAFRPETSIFSEEMYRNAVFVLRHGEVKYESNVVDFGQIWKPLEEPLVRRLTRPEFSKRPDYCHQKEYRFALYLVGRQTILPLRPDVPFDADPIILRGILS